MSIERKAPPGTKKLVWRITLDARHGKWVDPATIVRPRVEAPEKDSSTWAMSSFDLQYGADISEFLDTVPADLLDELFPPNDEPPKTAGKR